eukprot:GHVT01069141.1.p2 GENE.GHVT01069141.1~~GHVT01069141.1.p2  ORF type:complete len:113 (+),score=3.76 GHVT01069141.1:1050-1388(+)
MMVALTLNHPVLEGGDQRFDGPRVLRRPRSYVYRIYMYTMNYRTAEAPWVGVRAGDQRRDGRRQPLRTIIAAPVRPPSLEKAVRTYPSVAAALRASVSCYTQTTSTLWLSPI